MSLENEYKSLVDLVANARYLAAVSDNDVVITSAMEIKDLGTKAAKALGVLETEFEKDTVAKYMKKVIG